MIPALSFSEWLAVCTLSSGVIGSYALVQSQIREHGKRIIRLEERDEQSRLDSAVAKELLVRIDERTQEIKRKQESGHRPQ